MAFKIINCHKEHFPPLRLIGRRYTDADRPFDARWREWHDNGWMDRLEALGSSTEVESGAIGLMTMRTDHPDLPPEENGFSYWIGRFFPAGAKAPEGFACLDLPKSDVGVAWIYGSDDTGEIYGEKPHTAAYKAICKNGWKQLNENAAGEKLIAFFERYHPGRIDVPDKKGNVILDYGFYLQ